jgi:hypothetical protein
MTEQKSLIESVATVYLLIGAGVASISMCSTAVYYGFGPGAIWNLGFVAAGIGLIIGGFFSLLRVVSWPYGVYVLISDPDGFFPWLFYIWY